GCAARGRTPELRHVVRGRAPAGTRSHARVTRQNRRDLYNEKGRTMLFHVTWEFVDASEDGSRRSLAVFEKWEPPAGAEFQGFYGFAAGGGGVAFIEGRREPTLSRTT